ncbi:hypothetical protein Y1Q_0011105 [Alligator mississippiensis]|uniref:Uncharacterized protein n=1 Tax=Alligator mississippiensis TaxID=8496 RepID=A0A151PJJ5_ALLMI|nr:hypothetical protein Y1Q_0011105 [Alligator mississippiensis]
MRFATVTETAIVTLETCFSVIIAIEIGGLICLIVIGIAIYKGVNILFSQLMIPLETQKAGQKADEVSHSPQKRNRIPLKMETGSCYR